MALIGLGVAGAAGAFFAIAAKQALAYQEALTKVSITTNLSEEATATLGDAVSQAAIGTRAGAADMLNALAPVAGELQGLVHHALTAADATTLLKSSEDLAVATGTSLTSTTKTLTDTLLTYHVGTAQAASTASSLFEAHARLGIGVQQLGMMLQRLQPRIAGSGVDLQHLLGIAVELQPILGTGRLAISQVGAILSNLMHPAAKAGAALKALGINILDSRGKFIGFNAEIAKLHDAYGRLGTQAEKTAFLQALFGRNTAAGLELLKGGTAEVNKNVQALLNQGSAADAAAKANADVGAQFDIMRKDLEAAALAVGKALLPALTMLGKTLLPIFNELAQFASAHPQVVAAFFAIAGGVGALAAGLTILGPAIGGVTGLIGKLVAPLGLAGGLIGLLFAGAGGIAASMGLFGTQAQTAINTLVANVVSWVQTNAPVIAAAFESWAGAAVSWITGTAIPAALSAISTMVNAIANWIGDGTNVTTVVNRLASWTIGFLAWASRTGGQVVLALVQAFVDHIPQILSGAWTIGSSIVLGIGQAIAADPGAVVRGLMGLATAGLIVKAVVAVGGALGALFSTAFAAMRGLVALMLDFFGLGGLLTASLTPAVVASGASEGAAFVGAWEGSMAAMVPAAASAGSIAGGAFAASWMAKLTPLGIGIGVAQSQKHSFDMGQQAFDKTFGINSGPMKMAVESLTKIAAMVDATNGHIGKSIDDMATAVGQAMAKFGLNLTQPVDIAVARIAVAMHTMNASAAAGLAVLDKIMAAAIAIANQTSHDVLTSIKEETPAQVAARTGKAPAGPTSGRGPAPVHIAGLSGAALAALDKALGLGTTGKAISNAVCLQATAMMQKGKQEMQRVTILTPGQAAHSVNSKVFSLNSGQTGASGVGQASTGSQSAYSLLKAGIHLHNAVTVHVTLNSREVTNAISKMLFEEERRFAGPATSGSPF